MSDLTRHPTKSGLFTAFTSLVRVGRSAKLSPAADESLYSSDFYRVFSRVFNADLVSLSHFSFHRWRSHKSKSTLKKLSAFNISVVRGCYFEQIKRFCREQFFGISLHLFFLPWRCGRSPQLLTLCCQKSVKRNIHSRSHLPKPLYFVTCSLVLLAVGVFASDFNSYHSHRSPYGHSKYRIIIAVL